MLIHKAETVEPDDVDLCAKIRRGDHSAYESMFKKYYVDLYNYGIKLCAKPELVKDTIQDLFVRIWERREKMGNVRYPKAYLLTSLRRGILTMVRNRRREIMPVDQLSQLHAIQFTKEEIIISAEIHKARIDRLHKALNELPERQREIVYLRFYEGLSYDEIVQVLEINNQSLRNHIYRAIKTLRGVLDSDIIRSTSIS